MRNVTAREEDIVANVLFVIINILMKFEMKVMQSSKGKLVKI